MVSSPRPSMFMALRLTKCSILPFICGGHPASFGHRQAASPSTLTSGVPHSGQTVGKVNPSPSLERVKSSAQSDCQWPSVEQQGEGLLRLIVVPADDARVLVHDAHQQDPTLHRLLALMGQERNLEVAAEVQDELPIALGVIRDVEAPTYDAAVNEQIQNVRASAKAHTFDELTATLEQWS